MQKHTQSGFEDIRDNTDPFETWRAKGPNLSPAGLYGPVVPSVASEVGNPPLPEEPEPRGLVERVGDEISSWFGDEVANMRLEDDALNDAGGPEAAADEQLRLSVRDALLASPDLNGSAIDVEAANGEVRLTGAVLTDPEVYLAEECARGVAGVTHVHNDLLVRDVPGAQVIRANRS